MVFISKDISLQSIRLSDQAKLMALMSRIYPPSYKHLWVNEDCNWYMNFCYSEANLKKELLESESEYYFVIYKNILSGIIRFKYNSPFDASMPKNTAYLHRIYLDQDTHGKGLAKALCAWIDKKAKIYKQSAIWLEAMDTQIQALKFYEKCDYNIVNTRVLNFDRIHKTYRGMLVLNKSLF